MRPNSWADRLLALLVRFVGLVILLAAIAAAAASFIYNQSDEAEQAERVATHVNMRLHDHVAVLKGVRALYQSDSAASGPAFAPISPRSSRRCRHRGWRASASPPRCAPQPRLRSRPSCAKITDARSRCDERPISRSALPWFWSSPTRRAATPRWVLTCTTNRASAALRCAAALGKLASPLRADCATRAGKGASKVKQPGFLIYLPVMPVPRRKRTPTRSRPPPAPARSKRLCMRPSALRT